MSCMYLRKISSHTGAQTSLLGRSVDRDKDQISLLDSSIDISGEEQVLATTIKDNLLQSRFINRKFVRVPSVDTSLVQVNDSNLDMMTFVGNDSTSGTTFFVGSC